MKTLWKAEKKISNRKKRKGELEEFYLYCYSVSKAQGKDFNFVSTLRPCMFVPPLFLLSGLQAYFHLPTLAGRLAFINNCMALSFWLPYTSYKLSTLSGSVFKLQKIWVYAYFSEFASHLSEVGSEGELLNTLAS